MALAQERVNIGSQAVAAAGDRPRVLPRPRASLRGLELAVPIAILLIWQASSSIGILIPTIFPAPSAVIATLGDLIFHQNLAKDFMATLQRILIGCAIGVSAGIVLGGFAGYFRLAERALDSTVQALRSVPAVAWIPFLIVWLGIDDKSKIALLSLATFFPVYINAFAGVRSTDQKLIELARAYSLPRWLVIRKILFPSALPQLFVGIRLAAGIAWIAATFSEILFGNNGLGAVLNDGRSLGRPDQTVAVIIILALLGKGTDSLVRYIERRMTGWRSTFDGVGESARRAST